MKQQFSRFVRSEVMGRWQVKPVHLESIDVNRESLIRFLQDTFEFSRSRAEAEVDALLYEVEERLLRATDTRALFGETPAA